MNSFNYPIILNPLFSIKHFIKGQFNGLWLSKTEHASSLQTPPQKKKKMRILSKAYLHIFTVFNNVL